MGACCGKSKKPEPAKPTIKKVLTYTKAELADRQTAEVALSVIEEWIHTNPNDRQRPQLEAKKKEIKGSLLALSNASGISPTVGFSHPDSP